MATEIEYALMAGASYYDTRDEINRFPIPTGWVKITTPVDSHVSDPSTGFEAISFTNGTDLVISYAGTYDKDLTGDIAADIGLATGYGSAQLLQAAEYYLQVKALNSNSLISGTDNDTLYGEAGNDLKARQMMRSHDSYKQGGARTNVNATTAHDLCASGNPRRHRRCRH